MPLVHCIYSSVASNSFNEDEIPALLAHARAANQRAGITGMLTYIHGNFLQIVEGEESVIDALLSKLVKDPRHRRISLLVRENIAARSFADWSMGFESLLSGEVGDLIGENDFFESGECLSSLDAGIVKAILSAFLAAQTQQESGRMTG